MHTVWKFKTKQFLVSLQIEYEDGFQYDGDDEDGETQRMLDSGELVAFSSRAVVEFDGLEIADNWLGGSVYYADRVAEFWTAHRDPDPMNRNCSAYRAEHGNAVICHYFPDMVVTAISEARARLGRMPAMRQDAA